MGKGRIRRRHALPVRVHGGKGVAAHSDGAAVRSEIDADGSHWRKSQESGNHQFLPAPNLSVLHTHTQS